MKVVRQVEVDMEYGEQQVQLPLLIVEGKHKPALFGHDWFTAIKLHQLCSNTDSMVNRLFRISERC